MRSGGGLPLALVHRTYSVDVHDPARDVGKQLRRVQPPERLLRDEQRLPDHRGCVLHLLEALGRGRSLAEEALLLDASLAGSPQTIERTIRILGPHTRGPFLEGVRHGTAVGFARAMRMITLVCLGGALLSLWLLTPSPPAVARDVGR